MRKIVEAAETRCQWGDVTHRTAWLKPWRSQHNMCGQWVAYDGTWPARRRYYANPSYFPVGYKSSDVIDATKNDTETCRAYVVLQNSDPALIHTNGAWYVGNFLGTRHYGTAVGHIPKDQIISVSQKELHRLWELGMVQYMADKVTA